MDRPGTALLAGLLILSALAVDITLAALPATAAALGGEPARSGLIVTAYLAGFAPGQLLWGLFADRVGRRPAVLAGLAGFVAATAACALASSFAGLLAARVAQGLAGGAGPVLARTIVRDVAAGTAATRLFALLTTALGATPLIAPLVGAALLTQLDWRSIFWLTAAYGAALLAFAGRRLPETRPPPASSAAPHLIRRTVSLLRQRDYLLGLGLTALPFGGYHTILALYPAVAIVDYGVSEGAFALLFALTAAAYVSGALLSRLLVQRLGMRPLLVAAGALCVAGAAAVVVARGGAGLGWLAAGASLYVLGVGQMLPVATALALHHARESAGWAAALLGLVQIGGGALISFAATTAGSPATNIAAVLVACSLATGVVLVVSRGERLTAPRFDP